MRILLILFIISDLLFGQSKIITSGKKPILITSDKDLQLEQSDIWHTDSILIKGKGKPFFVNSIISQDTTKVKLLDNTEILLNADRFLAPNDNWVEIDGATLINNEDGTGLFSNIGANNDSAKIELAKETEENQFYNLSFSVEEGHLKFYEANWSTTTDGWAVSNSASVIRLDSVTDSNGLTFYNVFETRLIDNSTTTHRSQKNFVQSANTWYQFEFDYMLEATNDVMDGFIIANNDWAPDIRYVSKPLGVWQHVSFKTQSMETYTSRVYTLSGGTTTYSDADGNDALFFANFKVYELSDTSETIEKAKLIWSYGSKNDSTEIVTSEKEKYSFDILEQKEDDYYIFDGIDDKIDFNIDLAALYPDSFTVSFWAYMDAPSVTSQTFLSNGRTLGGSGNYGWGISHTTSSKFYLDFHSTAARNTTNFTRNPEPKEWFNLVVTFKNGLVNFYYNYDVQSSTKDVSPMQISNPSNYEFSVGSDAISNFDFDGGIKEVYFYNRVLTDQERLDLFNHKEVNGAIISLTNEDEYITNSTWIDKSGNNYNGTVDGATIDIYPKLKIWNSESNSQIKISDLSFGKINDNFQVSSNRNSFPKYLVNRNTVGNNSTNLIINSTAVNNSVYAKINTDVKSSSVDLLAPLNLFAFNTDQGIKISWSDPNQSTIANSRYYNFDNDSQLADWNPGHGSGTDEMSIENNMAKILDDNLATAYPNMNQKIVLSYDSTYLFETNVIQGTADRVGMFISTENDGDHYYNENVSDNRKLSYLMENVISDTCIWHLQASTSVDGQYGFHDNAVLKTLTAPYDGYEVWRREYVDNEIITAWELLSTINNHDSSYVDNVVLGKYGYKVRYFSDNTYSDFSLEDTTTYNKIDNPVIVSNDSIFNYTGFITLNSDVAGARYFYTNDGSTPTVNSQEYFEKIVLTENKTIKSIVKSPNGLISDVTTKNYYVTSPKNTISIGTHTFIEAEETEHLKWAIPRYDELYAANKSYIVFLDDFDEWSSSDIAYAEYKVTPNSTDNYDVWMRSKFIDNQYGAIRYFFNNDDGTVYLPNDDADNLEPYSYQWRKIDNDRAMTSGQTYSLKIASRSKQLMLDRLLITTNDSYTPSSYVVLTPAGGERILPSTIHEIRWLSTGTSNNVKIEVTNDGGVSWADIITSTPDDGSYNWSVPSVVSNDYLIRISNIDDLGSWDFSDMHFSVTNDLKPFNTNKTMREYATYSDTKVEHKRPDTYIADLEAGGGKKQKAEFLVHLNEFNGTSQEPHIEGYNAIRKDNENYTELVNYNNIFSQSVSNQDPLVQYGEGIWGKVTDPNFWMRDKNGNIVFSSEENERPGVDFSYPPLADYIVERQILHHSKGADGFYYDNFLTLTKKKSDNNHWIDAEPINKETGLAWTGIDWVKAFRKAIWQIDQRIDSAHGVKDLYTIWANGGTHDRVVENYDIIHGYLNELGFHAWKTDNTNSSGFYSRGEWEQDVNTFYAAQRYGLKYRAMGRLIEDSPSYQTKQDAAYYLMCSMLMGVKDPDAWFVFNHWTIDAEDWSGLDKVQMARFIPLGRYEEIQEGLYKREFTDALIFVNASGVDKTFSFPSKYYLKEDGTWSSSEITSKTLKTDRGLLLVDNPQLTVEPYISNIKISNIAENTATVICTYNTTKTLTDILIDYVVGSDQLWSSSYDMVPSNASSSGTSTYNLTGLTENTTYKVGCKIEWNNDSDDSQTTFRTSGSGGTQTIDTFYVGTNANDVFVSGGLFDFDYLNFGGGTNHIGIIFNDFSNYSSIDSVIVEFIANANSTSDDLLFEWGFEDVENPASFTSYEDFITRMSNKTTATSSIDYDENWVINSFYRFNVTNSLVELNNTFTFSNDQICLFGEDIGTTSGAMKSAKSYNDSPSNVKLIVYGIKE